MMTSRWSFHQPPVDGPEKPQDFVLPVFLPCAVPVKGSLSVAFLLRAELEELLPVVPCRSSFSSTYFNWFFKTMASDFCKTACPERWVGMKMEMQKASCVFESSSIFLGINDVILIFFR